MTKLICDISTVGGSCAICYCDCRICSLLCYKVFSLDRACFCVIFFGLWVHALFSSLTFLLSVPV